MARNGNGGTLINPSLPIEVQRVLRAMQGEINTLKTQLTQVHESVGGKLGGSEQDLLRLSGYVRDQLQASGSVPLSLSSLPGVAAQPQRALVPQTSALPMAGAAGAVIYQNGQLYRSDGTKWVPVGTSTILDTHANRLATYLPATYTAGTLFNETDRNVVYILKVVSLANAWVYLTGTQADVAANRPSDLGANDAGYQFFATDTNVLYEWSGTAWATMASNPPLPLSIANGGTAATTAAAARTNLGLGTAATQNTTAFDAAGAAELEVLKSGALFSSEGPVKPADLDDIRSLIAGGGSYDTAGAAATVQAASLQIASNLSDLNNAATARTNLAVPGLATNNTYSGTETYSSTVTFSAPASVNYGSNFANFTPTVTQNGTMTISAVSFNYAFSIRLGAALAYVMIDALFTTSGTPANTVILSLPITAFNAAGGMAVSAFGQNAGAWQVLIGYAQPNAAQFFVTPNFNNWSLGSCRIVIAGMVRIS